MANGQKAQPSAVFDAMLLRNRERFDALLRDDRSQPRGDDAGRPTAARGANDVLLDVRSSAAARYLNERFANRWHFDVVETHRAGDEAIVMCKLFVEEHGTKTQFGRATIAAGCLAGRTGTIGFRLELADTESVEQDAYRRAAENALANCVKLL
jgi:hypothetical protein